MRHTVKAISQSTFFYKLDFFFVIVRAYAQSGENGNACQIFQLGRILKSMPIYKYQIRSPNKHTKRPLIAGKSSQEKKMLIDSFSKARSIIKRAGSSNVISATSRFVANSEDYNPGHYSV